MRNALVPVLSCLFLVNGCGLTAANVQTGRLAQGPSKEAVGPEPTVAKELQYLVGTWVVTARDPGTNEAITINYKIEPSAGGRWLTGTGEATDLSLRSRDVWGIHPASGDILRFVYDGSGAYGTLRSGGWEGDRLVLEGEAQSLKGALKVRETITRVDQNRFDAVWEALREGRWQAYSIEQVVRR